MKPFCYLLAAAGVFLLAPMVIAQSEHGTLNRHEYKVMLKTTPFSSTNLTAEIDRFIAFLETLPDVTVDDKKKEKSRIVSYLDTKKCDLYKNNYILRKRFELKEGVPDHLKITLKYRGTDLDVVGNKSFQATPTKKMTTSKYEMDIVAKTASKTEEKLSYSANIALGKLKKVSDLVALYPVIKTLELDKNKKLKTVRDFYAYETVVDIGDLEIGDQKCEASLSFWYEKPEKTQPDVAEFSYVCETHTDKAQAVHKAILHQDNWFNSQAVTKTAFAYGDYCSNE